MPKSSEGHEGQENGVSTTNGLAGRDDAAQKSAPTEGSLGGPLHEHAIAPEPNSKRFLRWAGSKSTIAAGIVELMRGLPHEIYLEPYGGSLAVLLGRGERAKIEVVNDLNGDVAALYRVVKDDAEWLAMAVWATPWSRAAFEAAKLPTHGLTDRQKALRILIRTWQSVGMESWDYGKSGWRHSKCETATPAAVWMKLPGRILAAMLRLQGVQIEKRDGVRLVREYARPNILIYADPPYMRSARTDRLYELEMSDPQHEELLLALCDHPGPAILSGYGTRLYDEMLVNWRREELRGYSHRNSKGKTEVLWVKEAGPVEPGKRDVLRLF